MAEALQSSGLETLIARILNAESLQDTDKEDIAFLAFNGVFGPDYLEAMDIIGLETGLLSILARTNDWKKELKHLLGDRRLITALANELAGYSDYTYCPRGADLQSALDKLLDTVRMPVIQPPRQFRGIVQQDEFLSRTQRVLDDLSDDDQDRFKDLADRGWGELETLTKIILRFYEPLFEKSPELARAFSKAAKASGLNQRLDGIWSIEKKLHQRIEDNQDYVFKEQRVHCLWKLGRATPFEGLLDGKVETNLDEVPSRWSIKWQDVLTDYDNSKADATGDTWISTLNYHKTNVHFYRHFYAHSNRQEWLHAGREMVRRSFEAAEELIKRIIELRLCPEMIIPIAVGQDGFQRRVAFFVHEKDLKSDGTYSRHKVRMMFLGGDQFVHLHRFYFCPYPAKSGVFEPFLVLADEAI